MHIALFTRQMDEMIKFYTEKLGAEVKYKATLRGYLDRDDRPEMQAAARMNPDAVLNVYLEIAPQQFLEFFPANPAMAEDAAWNSRLGYSHFAVMVDDIFEAYEEFMGKGVPIDNPPSKGPSETWQFWCTDPDGNRFEVMQYTEKSYQLVGAPE